MNSPSKDELIERLRPFGQQHLLRFWDELSTPDQKVLSEQIAAIDLAQLATLAKEARTATQPCDRDQAQRARRAEPPPAIRLADQQHAIAVARARARGEEALRDGRIGVILVAGGQGTRLGFDHPKALYPIGPLSHTTLLEILCQKQLATRRRYAVNIPLYLMTSPATHAETVAALDEHDRFGLPEVDVQVFCQGMMPAVDDTSGQLLLEEKGRLFLSPDGHGGMLRALLHSGALADIRRRGIDQLFYYQVDNPLVAVCDPLFIGYHLEAKAEVSTQVVAKQTPLDRVGNVVSVDGQVQIIEYSDLADDVAEQRAADGSLKLWAGNIAVHMFDVPFLERMSAGGGKLPFHFAHKKVPFIDDGGRLIEPDAPNAIKFEQFIFDLLPAAHRALVVEVDERAVFAPLKNASGSPKDSPETVRAQMVELHRRWLCEAGATVEDGSTVEISPLFALDAAELAGKISEGLHVTADRYFC